MKFPHLMGSAVAVLNPCNVTALVRDRRGSPDPLPPKHVLHTTSNPRHSFKELLLGVMPLEIKSSGG